MRIAGGAAGSAAGATRRSPARISAGRPVGPILGVSAVGRLAIASSGGRWAKSGLAGGMGKRPDERGAGGRRAGAAVVLGICAGRWLVAPDPLSAADVRVGRAVVRRIVGAGGCGSVASWAGS